MGFSRCGLLFSLIFLCGTASAQEAQASPESLVWRCWYDGQTHISCFVESLPGTAATAYTPPPGLPPVVQQLRTRPEAFRNRFLHIPLYTPPYDMERVATLATLAQAIVCGERPQCAARFTPAPTQSELAPLLATWDDPILNAE